MRGMFGAQGGASLELPLTARAMRSATSPPGCSDGEVIDTPSVSMGVYGRGARLYRSLDGNVLAAVDGEVYNDRELARQSDSSSCADPAGAIIALYERAGLDFARHLNGAFAIALWDERRRRLLLVRDHLGARSVFYAVVGEAVYFGSCVRSVLAGSRLVPQVVPHALQQYFVSTAICAPDTLLRGVSCVRPGTTLVVQDSQVWQHEYWDAAALAEEYQPSEEEWIERTRALIVDAITLRARVPGRYGALVSGGLDTSVISATLASEFHNPAHPLPAFSIAFQEEEFSDAPLQRLMCREYPLEPVSHTLTAQSFVDILVKGAAALDKPVNDNAYVGMYRAFEMAKDAGCEAVFDGEAADELFFTGHAHGERWFQRFATIPAWLRHGVLRFLFPYRPVGDGFWDRARRLAFRISLTDAERILTRLPTFHAHPDPILTFGAELMGVDPLKVGKDYLSASRLREPLNRYHYGLVKTFLAEDLLFKNDRMARAHGILNRTPFADFRLVELAFQIPSRFKLSTPTLDDDGTKQVYKKAVRGLVPPEILARKKARGFSHPTRLWYAGVLRDFVVDTLLAPQASLRQYVNDRVVRRLVEQHLGGVSNHDYLLSSLLILELWLEEYAS